VLLIYTAVRDRCSDRPRGFSWNKRGYARYVYLYGNRNRQYRGSASQSVSVVVNAVVVEYAAMVAVEVVAGEVEGGGGYYRAYHSGGAGSATSSQSTQQLLPRSSRRSGSLSSRPSTQGIALPPGAEAFLCGTGSTSGITRDLTIGSKVLM